MFKKIFSVILTASIFVNTIAFAALENTDGTYIENFEGYASSEDIMADGSVIKNYKGVAPTPGSIGENPVMVVDSVSGADTIVYTNPELFEGDVNVFKFKIGADQAPKLNWKSSSSLVVSHTDDSGNTVTDYIFDFAWSLVRHKENGTSEKGICGFAAKKLYSVVIKTSKVKKDGDYFYDIAYSVDGNEYSVSFPSTEDGTMCIGFKSTIGNKLYIDDIETYSIISVLPSVSVEGRSDVCVKPLIEVEFSDAIDESTLLPDAISAGDVKAGSIESLGDNKYLITLETALKKNTEYVLDLGVVRDANGNALRKSTFEFKTSNTAVIAENGELVNTSDAESENIVIYTPDYDESGAMTNKSANHVTLAPGEAVTLENEEFFAVSEDFTPVAASVFPMDGGKTEEDFGAYYDGEEGVLTVFGKTDSAFKDEKISLKLENSDGALIFAGITKTSSGGYFSISYPFSEATGNYRIFAKSVNEEFSENIKIINSEDAPTLKEDFESYTKGSEIIAGSRIIEEATKESPEIENLSGKAMAVGSGTVYTYSEIFDKDLSILKCKIGADLAPKLNWGSSSSLVFSHSNESGIIVDDYIFDFAWSLVRHRENGEAEKGICGFAPQKIYDVEIKVVKVSREERFFYDVTYTVDGAENKISYPTSEDGKMRIGFMSTSGNRVYVDDIEVSGFDLINPKVNIANRTDVSVKPLIEITFPGEVDIETVSPSSICIENIYAGAIEYAGDGKYLITLSEALVKNKEYVLDISSVLDFYGNPLMENKFNFKTKNTAVVIENGEVFNTSHDESENITVITPSYNQSGTMTGKTIVSRQIGALEKYNPESDKFLVLTPDSRPVASEVYVPSSGIKNDEFKVEFNSVTQKMTVSGKTAGAYADEIIAIGVQDKNGEFDYVCTTKTGENGYFAISYTPASKSGKYTVFAKSMTEEFSSNAVIRLKKDAGALLDSVNSGNEADIIEALELYDDVISSELDLYNNLTDKSFIASGLKNSAPYKSVEELTEAVEILALANCIKSADKKTEVFEGYEHIVFEGEDEIFEMWKSLSGADKNSALDSVISSEVFAPSEFKNGILSETILAMVHRAGKYIDVKNAIENHHQILGIDLEDYEKAKKPSSVAKGLCGKKWTLKSFTNEFDELVEKALESDSGKKGSSGGLGGGGSSVPGNIALPQVQPGAMDIPNPDSGNIKTGFTDVSASFWAKEAIDSLSERKILTGYEDGSFRPEERITREEFVTVIVRYLGLSGGSGCSFDDVKESDWFYPYVSAAYENKIISGMSETLFGSGMPITRQDAAVIFYNINKSGAPADFVVFTDNQEISAYAKEAVNALSGRGIISGNPDGSFNPKGLLTRAEAAKMIFTYDKEADR